MIDDYYGDYKKFKDYLKNNYYLSEFSQFNYLLFLY